MNYFLILGLYACMNPFSFVHQHLDKHHKPLFIYLLFFVFLLFLGPLPRHMEVPRPGVELEL